MKIENEEQANEALAALSRYFREPVMPVGRYCEKLRAWQRAIDERASRKRAELFPGIDADYYKDPSLKETAEKAWEAYRAAKKEIEDPLKAYAAAGKMEFDKRYYALQDLKSYESLADAVGHVFLQISKSNMLARVLYAGEKVRTKMCPEHKGKWSGIEWRDNQCPHGCQLTGWIQEPDDQGMPLPGVQAVQLVPTGEPGEVTMIRDVDGEVLGKAKVFKPGEEK